MNAEQAGELINDLKLSVLVEGDPFRGPHDDEELAILDEATRRGFDAGTSTLKTLAQALETPRFLVAGSLPFIERALNLLGHTTPNPVDYPSALNGFYDRMFWNATIGEVRRWMNEGRDPVFVKPSASRKRFRGLVVSGPDDLWKIASISARLPVVCSNVVSWSTEWRAFVHAGELVGLHHYDGDPNLTPDRAAVAQMIDAIVDAGQAPAGFALDIGIVTDSGKTAVVEMNDGFALGRYGLDPAKYFDLIQARWAELTTPTK